MMIGVCLDANEMVPEATLAVGVGAEAVLEYA